MYRYAVKKFVDNTLLHFPVTLLGGRLKANECLHWIN